MFVKPGSTNPGDEADGITTRLIHVDFLTVHRTGRRAPSRPVGGLPHPTLTPRGDGSTYVAAIEVGAEQTMITRTEVQAVAEVAKGHRRTGMRFCEWMSSALPASQLAPEMRGGNRGSPDFMRR